METIEERPGRGIRRGGLGAIPLLHGLDLVLALSHGLGRPGPVAPRRDLPSHILPVLPLELGPVPQHPLRLVRVEEARHRSFAPFVPSQPIAAADPSSTYSQ